MALTKLSADSPAQKSQTLAPRRAGVYAAFLAAVIVGAFAYDLRQHGIFACPATGYGSETYLAYCNSTGYGDYDHGAFWFNHEPQTRAMAASAQVLFLGSSRLAFGLSSDATRDWAKYAGVSYYILGFSHSENIQFVAPLIDSLSPHAKAYVINADNFFVDRETPPVEEIRHGTAIESRYNRKRIWQYPHRVLCGAFSFLCGHEFAFYRTRGNGTWTFVGPDSLVHGSVADYPIKDEHEVRRHAENAQEFIAKLHVRKACVILTVVPWTATPRDEAQAIAEHLGVSFVAPASADLHTFDGSHLDHPSAERWSRKFFAAAGDQIRGCVSPQGSAD